jgi:hypothetical protein
MNEPQLPPRPPHNTEIFCTNKPYNNISIEELNGFPTWNEHLLKLFKQEVKEAIREMIRDGEIKQ